MKARQSYIAIFVVAEALACGSNEKAATSGGTTETTDSGPSPSPEGGNSQLPDAGSSYAPEAGLSDSSFNTPVEYAVFGDTPYGAV